MNKIIGSEFFLDLYEPLEDKDLKLDYLNLNIKDTVFISDSNDAISFVLEQNRFLDDEKIALLPSFTSSNIVDQLIDGGYKVFFHLINKDLTFNRKLFLEDIERIRPTVVIVHGYFGFDSLESIKDIIKNIETTGTLVIEDITQTLYSNIEHAYADYYILNFKIWTALPDGGCVISRKKSFSFKPFEVDISYLEKKLEAMHAKYLYIDEDIGVKEDFLNLFYEADRLLLKRSTIYAMSPISKTIQANVDIEFLRNRRRRNYEVLYGGLIDSNIVEPIFGQLEKGIVPLYFPLYSKCNKDELKAYLAENYIYLPTICSKPENYKGNIGAVGEWIYENILTIPCDQRYIDSDMKRIVKVIRDYESSINTNKKIQRL